MITLESVFAKAYEDGKFPPAPASIGLPVPSEAYMMKRLYPAGLATNGGPVFSPRAIVEG